jgi:hypothetical protein
MTAEQVKSLSWLQFIITHYFSDPISSAKELAPEGGSLSLHNYGGEVLP